MPTRPRARPVIPLALRYTVLERDGFRCRYCGRSPADAGVKLQLDHVVPLAAGGPTSDANLVTACGECNLGKGSRSVGRDRL